MRACLVVFVALAAGCSVQPLSDPNEAAPDRGSSEPSVPPPPPPAPSNAAPKTKACGPDEMSAWSEVKPLSEKRARHAVTVKDGIIYVIAGTTGSGSAKETTYFAKANADGSLADWQTAKGSTVSGGVEDGIAFTDQGRNFLVGGHQGGQFDTLGNPVFHAVQPRADGGFDTWTKTQGRMFGARARGALVKGRIYVYGGGYQQGAPIVQSATYRADATGALVDGMALPPASEVSPIDHEVVGTADRVYVLGGNKGPSVFVSGDLSALPTPFDPGWSTWWRPQDPLPRDFRKAAGVAFESHIFLTGGLLASAPTNEVWTALAGADGSLGKWQRAKDLPSPIYDHAAVTVGEYLYVVGGRTKDDDADAKVYVAKLCR